MTSITAQQTKLNLELVPKENRLDIGKCSGRIPRGLKLKEKTFQVVLDALAITPCYPTFVITADVPKVYLHHPQMKESKAYKTYLGYAIGTVPPKVARKFKKASPSKKDSMPVPADEEPIQKGKRVKRSANKSLTTPTTSIVIREPLVETQSKRKEKVDVAHGKGINLLSEVALTEEAQMKEVRKKSLRDFHKSHLSGSGSVAENPPSVKKITSPVTSKGTDDSNDKERSEQENDSEEHESESEQDTDGSESDFECDQQDDDDDDDEVKDDDEDDDDSLKSTPLPLPTTETTNIPSSILDFALVFRFNDRVIALEKDVAELKNDPLHTQVTSLVDDHLDTRMGVTKEEFMNFLSASLTDRITE
nr:hypothetical protein [Tanacetum cinerariifolium]